MLKLVPLSDHNIQISADDTLHEHDKGKRAVNNGDTEADPMLAPGSFQPDPESFEFADDDDDDAPQLDEPGNKVLNSDEEWRASSPSNK